MIPQESLLVELVKLIDLIPTPALGPPKRGRPMIYPEKLFLKALLIMIVKHLHKVHELLSVLNEPTFEIQQLCSLLTENGRYPARQFACPNWLFWALSGRVACTLGELWTSGCSG